MSQLSELVLHLRGLVLVRGILEQRGASAAELEEHDSAIERVREDLARLSVEDARQAA